MIRFFVILGVVSTLVVGWLATAGVGPETQLPPEESLLVGFREKGFVPESLNLEENEAAEEGIFDVPAMDEMMLEAAMEAMDMDGMDMGGMDMSEGAAPMNMDGGEGAMDMAADSGSMNMDSESGAMNMAADSGAMNMDGDSGSKNMAADSGAMNMDGGNGGMNMAMGSEAMEMDDDDDEMAEPAGGLLITASGEFDREINLTMTEWGFSEMELDVKVGERIRFTVKNGGQIPHEFMFMNMALMEAVKYRATRADWSLFEHEALFEQALVLPGGDFDFVVEVQEAGTWMFMCMLPYHMQMGMMGQMSTPGMAMEM
jgi:uncharacterized cupredoxin-like copper-binding protein